MLAEFEGEDLTLWAKHFRLSEKCLQCLCESLEANSVLDLIYVYEDTTFLQEVEKSCTKIEYKRFLDARRFTKCLQEAPLPAAAVSMPNPITPALQPNPVYPVLPPPPQPVRADNTILPPCPPSYESSISFTSDSSQILAEGQRKLDKELSKLRRHEEKQRELIEVEKARIDVKEKTSRVKDRNALITSRKQKIQSLLDQLREATSIDIAFVMDCSGSMSSYIENCKLKVTNFVEEIKRLHPNVSLRLAFVGYRDHFNQEKRLEVFRFTPDLPEFCKFVSELKAISNTDDAEDVLGGLHVAKGLNWFSHTKILYHIGDSPCHGREFHGPDLTDNHPDGCPNGLKAEDILLAFRELQIIYYFGQIRQEHTEIMITRFNEIAGPPAPYIKITDMNHGNMMDIVTQSVSTVFSSIISSSSQTDKNKGAMRDVVIDKSPPNWTTRPIEKVLKYSMSLSITLDELIKNLLENGEDKCINDFPDNHNPEVKAAQSPFAKGSTRAAYYGRFIGADGTDTHVIFKESLYINPLHLTKQKYENYLSCHRAAKLLANQFNERKPADCARIEFCEASIVHFLARRGQPYLIMESAITDKYEKYNGNNGFYARNPTQEGVNHDAVQAFSHWTYEFSEKQMMVVDCQGGFNRATNTFLLTDPAVHFKDLSQFGGTNMGIDGFRLFSKHVCNPICAALKLPPIVVP